LKAADREERRPLEFLGHRTGQAAKKGDDLVDVAIVEVDVELDLRHDADSLRQCVDRAIVKIRGRHCDVPQSGNFELVQVGVILLTLITPRDWRPRFLSQTAVMLLSLLMVYLERESIDQPLLPASGSHSLLRK
jgi:hypothetical protein